jgi:hypothetical protein
MEGVDNAATWEGFDLAQLNAHPFRLGALWANAHFDGLSQKNQVSLI